jgi:hypothetical protein
MKGVLPWMVRWACHAGSRDFYPVLAALVGLIQNIFPHYTLFHSFASIAYQAGQAVMLGHLSFSIHTVSWHPYCCLITLLAYRTTTFRVIIFLLSQVQISHLRIKETF